MQRALEFLERVGAAQRGHARGSLMDHLVGTWRLLQAWSCTTPVCLAGLFHSVYGTSLYTPQSLRFCQRDEVQGLVGHEAEELAFLFCIADRPAALWDALDSAVIIDRLSGNSHAVSRHQALGLIEIECANCLEQGLGLSFLQEAWSAARTGRVALRAPLVAALGQAVGV